MVPPHELLWIETPGGCLAASFHLPESDGPVPAVMLCHGFTGHRGEAHFLFVEAARAFADAGIAALRFDFRGSGESEPAFSQMTLDTEIADAEAVLQYLISRPEVDAGRIAVLGLSMGGAVAACLAGRDSVARSGQGRIAALVLWAPVARFDGLLVRLSDPEAAPPMLPDGTRDLGGIAIGPDLLESLATTVPVKEVAAYTGPALIVHGTNDQAVPLSHAHEYRCVLGHRATLHLVEGADHVFSSIPWQTQAIWVTTEFLVKHLA
ncbi:MAG: alpha/beta fold hydrolase [Armatimonadetes bacterium]|nr:alpha/beta fold hydrolase [Armatimonadota bacterium]